MPQPTRSDVHVNAPLTNIMTAYIQKREMFIADKVFPMVPVAKESDRYFTYPKGNWFRNTAQERADGAESSGGGFTVDNTPSYACKLIAHHKDVSDRVRQNADAPLNLDRDSTEYVAQQLLLRREKDFAGKYFITGLWTGSSTGTDITPGTLWDAANSSPLKDIEAQKDAMEKQTGYTPNVIVVSPDVNVILKNHDEILDRIKYTQRGVITEELLAAFFGVDKYLVAKGIENTAAEGQLDVMARIFTAKDVLLVYAADRPSLMMPSAGYTFAWTGLLGAGAYGGRMKKFRMEHLESDRIEGEMSYDQKLIASDCGVFFNNVIS